ncbi:ADP-forming succinate--CoA ligase subunit beta [bacterium]|nr:ADP-forming succinate--CoA ligase subunit beta [bacterium]MDA9753619.1 ADP-forming succinate--CoA ligase subunit beta [bacterium]NSW95956.1 ADP-forming succinate--CoA ligase subunit beta [bacterium]|tara:strand:- start:442 stop:1599 length:1158 start_codon:yes stop_codon:yes gene_type:complete
MNIHEYQAKDLFRKFNINTSEGKVFESGKDAEDYARSLNSKEYVVKAQIHAGGRGKAGGVKLVKTPEEVGSTVQEMLGMTLVTHQTGPEGKLVNKVYVENSSIIDKEYYLSIVTDRSTEKNVIIASPEGGMDIEKVADETPEKLLTQPIDPVSGIQPFHIRKIAYFLGFNKDQTKQLGPILSGIYKLYTEMDCALVEINPLISTDEGEIKALDAKINFDDNAEFRHKEFIDLHDPTEEEPLELEAKKWGFSFVKLDGNIGCLVNGAGLAMATMDIIKFHGEEPANFLDVGGGASVEQVTQAFKMILSDQNVKAILVNIFGGIMKCDTIADGIIIAAKEVGIKVPLVVRLEGTNVELGKKILEESDLNITTADTMKDAASTVVSLI